MADSGRVAHAMLMYENEGCGALALALAYVQYLNCSNPHDGDSCGECPSCRQMAKLIHPDVHFVFPVNKGPKSADERYISESYIRYWRELALADPYFVEADLQRAIGIEAKNGLIAVAEAKYIIGKLSLTSVGDGYKAVIFYLPEKMNQETANRLLKMVEEPPEKTLFIFITHAPEKVLQTIFSRCQSVRVLPLTKEEAEEVKALRPDFHIKAKSLPGLHRHRFPESGNCEGAGPCFSGYFPGHLHTFCGLPGCPEAVLPDQTVPGYVPAGPAAV